MDYNVEPVLIDTDGLEFPGIRDTARESRAANYRMYDRAGTPKCTVAVIGWQRLHKTKYCVECILKYTQDVDYELILVDGGSTDGTYEFYRTVEHPNKKIIRLTQNMGLHFLWPVLRGAFTGKYLAVVSNDIYVTQNWLSNLLTCMESDAAIGFVEPVSSNVSNFQQVDLPYSNFDEMQSQAAAFNVSDAAKWQERLRLVSPIVIYSRPVLDTVGVFDSAFVHDFAEDDYSARLRRAGYKLMLCGDTWICHDHDFRNMEDKDPAAFQRSLDYGRAVYREKYHGIDPWDDINNYEHILLSPLDALPQTAEGLRVLAVDVRCGTPVLEIRNCLRRRGMTCAHSQAFTTQAKYYQDLLTVCDAVDCGRIDDIGDYCAEAAFDIIVLGEPLNAYSEPLLLLKRLYGFLKSGGVLLLKLQNTDGFRAFLHQAIGGQQGGEAPASFALRDAVRELERLGGREISVKTELEPISAAEVQQIFLLARKLKPTANETDLARLIAQHYCVKVVKA